MLLTEDHTREVYSLPNRRYYFEIVNKNGGYEGAFVLEGWLCQAVRVYIHPDGDFGLSSTNRASFADRDKLFAIAHKMNVWDVDNWFVSRRLPVR